MKTRRKKQTQKEKNLFTMTSGDFMIVLRKNSFIDIGMIFKILILRLWLQPTVEGPSLPGPNNWLQLKVKITAGVQHCKKHCIFQFQQLILIGNCNKTSYWIAPWIFSTIVRQQKIFADNENFQVAFRPLCNKIPNVPVHVWVKLSKAFKIVTR